MATTRCPYPSARRRASPVTRTERTAALVVIAFSVGVAIVTYITVRVASFLWSLLD